jgi:hypothetical protein
MPRILNLLDKTGSANRAALVASRSKHGQELRHAGDNLFALVRFELRMKERTEAGWNETVFALFQCRLVTVYLRGLFVLF